jgi:hypothetical protein
MTDFALSPDGENIAFMMPWEHRLNIFVRQVEATKVSRITSAQKRVSKANLTPTGFLPSGRICSTDFSEMKGEDIPLSF